MDHSSDHLLPDWIYVPELESSITQAETLEDFLNNNTILLTILNNINEGISILNTDLQIVFMNKPMLHWYSYPDNPGRHKIKCYRLFHSARRPCENCPAIICLNTDKPHSAVVGFRQSTEKYGQVQIHVAPIHNARGEIVLLLEYVQNLTIQNYSLASLEDLSQEFHLLETQNKLLLNSLTQKEKQYQELLNIIERNHEEHIRPVLNYLKKQLPEKDYELVSSIIEQSFSPLLPSARDAAVPPAQQLTSREYQVAVLIKKGLSSKEIADQLFITKKAVDYHRANIRKKLNLSPKDNLQVYLEVNL